MKHCHAPKPRDLKKYVTAFIYDKRGRLLSFGKNSFVKTHPLMAKLALAQDEPHKIFLHAEVDAFIKCKEIKRAYKIRVIATDINGHVRSGKPCKICLELIKQSSIKEIEHS